MINTQIQIPVPSRRYMGSSGEVRSPRQMATFGFLFWRKKCQPSINLPPKREGGIFHRQGRSGLTKDRKEKISLK